MNISRSSIPHSSGVGCFETWGIPEEIEKDDEISVSSAEDIVSNYDTVTEPPPPPEGLEEFWHGRSFTSQSQLSSMRPNLETPVTPRMSVLKIGSAQGSTRGSNDYSVAQSTTRRQNVFAHCSNDNNIKTTNIINIGRVDTKGFYEILKHHNTISEGVSLSMVAGNRRIREEVDGNNMNLLREADHDQKSNETADISNGPRPTGDIKKFDKYQRVEPPSHSHKSKRRNGKFGIGNLSSKGRYLLESGYPYSYVSRTRKLHPEGNLNKFIVSLNKDRSTTPWYGGNKSSDPTKGSTESQHVSFALDPSVDKQSVEQQENPLLKVKNQLSNSANPSFLSQVCSDSRPSQIGDTSNGNFEQSLYTTNRQIHQFGSPVPDASMASIDLLISRQVDPIKKKLDNLIGEIATLTPSTSVDAEVKLLSRKVDNMVNEMSKELREIRDIIKKLGEAPKQEPATSNVGIGCSNSKSDKPSDQTCPQEKEIMLDSKVVSKSLGFSFGRTTIPQECTTSLTNVTSAPGFSIPSPSGAIDVGQNAIEIAQPFTAVPSFTFATPPAVITASSKIVPEGKFATTTVAANSDSTPAQPSKATGGFSFSTGPSTGTTPVAVDTLSSFGVKPSMGISASATPAPFSFGVSGATPITSASVSAPLGNVNSFSQVAARNSEGVASRAAATQPWSNLSSGATVPTTTTNLFGLSSVSDKKTEQKGFDALAPKSSDGATSNPFSINASSGSSFERVDSAIVPNPLVTDPIGDKPLHNSGFSFPNSANHNANVHPSTGKPQGAPPNAASWNSSFGTGVFGGGPVQTTQEPTTSTAINTSGTPGTTVNLFSSHVSNSAGSVGFGTVSSFGSSTFLDKAPRPKKKRTY